MAEELARYSPLSLKSIMLLETASIIKICALRAKIASKAAIKRSVTTRKTHDFKSEDESLVYTNVNTNAGRVWFVPGDKLGAVGATRATRVDGPAQTHKASLKAISVRGNFFMVYATGHAAAWHLPDFYWQAYLLAVGDREAAIKARIAELNRRRGLMLLSWLQIGDAIGVSLSNVSPAGALDESTARAARGPGGRSFTNGTGSTRIGRSGLIITIENRSPLAIKRQGQRELDRAVAQRVKGFRIALAKGVLNDLQLRAARWKGIFVRPA